MRTLLRFTLLPILFAAACGGSPHAGAHRDVPIFIISIDTLRSDHLAAYGYRAGRTPALDRFRADSILFARAFSHCPQTLPSHATLLTGQLPADNGVRDNIGYILRAGALTLPRLLKQQRYATGAAVSSYVLRRATGIDQGFDFFDDNVENDRGSNQSSTKRDGDRTRQALEQWLDQRQGDRIFALLHLYEPHAPYEPPAEYSDLKKYDGEIAYADAIVGRFLESLRRRNLYERAFIVIMSDHGEGLGDHGEEEHGVLLYREALQVPLMIKLPSQMRRGTFVNAPAALSDLAPTVLAVAGMASPSVMQGVNLLTTMDVSREIYSETYFPRLHLGWHELTSLTGTRFHLIEGRARELFDDATDARETVNVADSNRRVFAAMSSRLTRFPTRFSPPSAVDPDDQRKLAALGYIGASIGSGPDLPDPKDKIHSLSLLHRAVDELKSGNDAQAERTLQELVRESPNMVDAWALQARIYRSRGDNKRALESLHTAMKLFPNDANVALALSDLLLATGDLSSARKHAELGIAGNPTLAHEQLARIALKSGDLANAGREAAAALSASPHRTATMRLIAEVNRREQRWQDELTLLDQAAAEIQSRHMRSEQGLSFDRGEALLHLQRGPEAEEAFAAEVRDFPQNLQAWADLAVVRAAKGDIVAARGTLQEMLRANPNADARRIARETTNALAIPSSARER